MGDTKHEMVSVGKYFFSSANCNGEESAQLILVPENKNCYSSLFWSSKFNSGALEMNTFYGRNFRKFVLLVNPSE